MKLLLGLFGRKSAKKQQTRPVSGIEVDANWNETLDQAEKADAAQVAAAHAQEFETEGESEGVQNIPSALDSLGQSRGDGVVNIWDLDEGGAPAATAEATAAKDDAKRARRNRTRLIGFDKSDSEVVDLFDGAPRVTPTGERTQFPAGLLLVTAGPGRGYGFPLKAGMSTIGRGEDQAVALDFGDNAISRSTHAAVAYDADKRSFMLGHGGKANIVRLNGKPVIANEMLADGDTIQIGETTLQLKTICGADFDWSDTDVGEDYDDDVAIA